MNGSPCLDCRFRKLCCHSECESYLQYRRKLDKINKIKKLENDTISYIVLNVIKIKLKTR